MLVVEILDLRRRGRSVGGPLHFATKCVLVSQVVTDNSALQSLQSLQLSSAKFRSETKLGGRLMRISH